jgi:hypothetical protein
MADVEIYGLYDPDTDELRYIGKANNAAKRLKTHLFERKLTRPVNRWVKSLVDQGKAPVMRVLEVVAKDLWEEAERRLIAQHRGTAKLLNLADGGAGPYQTKEQRKKAAKASNEAQLSKTPAWRAWVRAKQDMARLHSKFMREGPRSYRHAAILGFFMRIDAAAYPELYGSWANL